MVVNCFRKVTAANETADEIRAMGREAIVVKANIGELDELNRLFDETKATFGGIDIFISNAASGTNKSALEQKPKGWDWTMNINARAFLFGAQRAAQMMKERGGGYIVSLTSDGSQRVVPGYIITGASKAAIDTLMKYLSVELAPLGICVNAVSPGLVATDALQYIDALSDGSVLPRAVQATPAGRLATTEDIAGVVAFLCTPEAEMIRGQIIVVDGGFSHQRVNVIEGLDNIF
jgi:enoyl-[acyl-carrier protein] reductase III